MFFINPLILFQTSDFSARIKNIFRFSMLQAELQAIKGKSKFDELFKSSIKIKNKDCLALIKTESTQNENNPNANRIIFYAVAISKKTAKKAVIRNRIKRLIRESFRQLLMEESNLFSNISNIIVIWRWAPTHSNLIGLKEVKQSVRSILVNFQSSAPGRTGETL